MIFVPLPALHTGRIAGLAVTGILTVAYIFITAHELLSYFTRKKRCERTSEPQDIKLPEIRIEDTSKYPASPQSSPIQFPMPSLALTPTSSHSLQDTASSTTRTSRRERKPKRQRRQEWSPDLDPMLLGITIFQIIVFAYFVAMTELLLRHNPAADSSQDSSWGFGQVRMEFFLSPLGFLCIFLFFTFSDVTPELTETFPIHFLLLYAHNRTRILHTR